MTTFNVDSLDFSDDEEVRVGAGGDFGVSYDSGNDALEIEDRVNTAIASIPRGTSTDLVGGKFAEAVSEGKALADDGNVYDSIQQAVDNANSWVKVGPGRFTAKVVIDTADLTFIGCGDRTFLDGSGISDGSSVVNVQANGVTVKNIRVNGYTDGSTSLYSVRSDNNRTVLKNITSMGTDSYGFDLNGSDCAVLSCELTNSSQGISWYGAGENNIAVNNVLKDCGAGIYSGGADIGSGVDSVIANNQISDSSTGMVIRGNDTIVYGNIIENVEDFGIDAATIGGIFAKNRLINTDGINNEGSGNNFDSNLVTE